MRSKPDRHADDQFTEDSDEEGGQRGRESRQHRLCADCKQVTQNDRKNNARLRGYVQAAEERREYEDPAHPSKYEEEREKLLGGDLHRYRM
jgi:hypothetical protein